MKKRLAHHRSIMLGWIILCFLALGSPAMATPASTGQFPEMKQTNLPQGKTLIQETQKILRPAQPLDFSRLADGYRALPLPIREAIHKAWQTICSFFSKIWSLFVRSRQQRLPAYHWVDWVRVISLPLIIATIAFFLYQLQRRLRRDIHEGTAEKKVSEESWQKLWKSAWRQRESSPREALHGLMAAVVRRLIVEGRIPEDPSQTLREIERYLKKHGGVVKDVSAFSSLRGWYEWVYYGQQPLTEGDWESIRQAVGCFLGEAPMV